MSSWNSNDDDQGVVIRKEIGNYKVLVKDRIITCNIASRLLKQLIFSSGNPNASSRRVDRVLRPERTDRVVVGDSVRVIITSETSGAIVDVSPRRNCLVRRDPASGSHPFKQVIASNLDWMAPVFAVGSPPPKWGLLDRYLVSAEIMEIQSLIVVTKSDLLESMKSDEREQVSAALEIYRSVGYPIVLTSSLNGDGITDLLRILMDKVSVFVGKSGVGKSSLLNAIEPGLALRVGAVGGGKLGKGRHTTSQVEMIPLKCGGSIIDTPGEREFGLLETEPVRLALAFPEIRDLVGQCKFGMNCSHDEEPGCMVRHAVLSGRMHPLRYRSYLQLKRECK